VIGADRWEILERIGAYAAGELSGEEARETERFILENAEGRRLVESYARMFVLLNALGEETPEPPEAILNYAVRRATVSAFFRQAEEFFASMGRAYFNAFLYYFGLRRVDTAGGPARQGI
jgi:anti-sigma-K factor RskA